MNSTSLFSRFARWASDFTGHAKVFAAAALLIFVWLLTGPMFDFGNTWQLVINTLTTIITFLMVFLIQNSQNRDTKAIQLKLDELIRATQGAHNALMDLEELEEHEIEAFRKKYRAVARAARKDLDEGLSDIDCPDA